VVIDKKTGSAEEEKVSVQDLIVDSLQKKSSGASQEGAPEEQEPILDDDDDWEKQDEGD